MTVATYGDQYHQYPVFTAEDGLSFEGATKRFKTMPTPQDVFNFAMLGLPKHLTMTNEVLTPADCALFLENAITEIEMGTCMNITPVDHFQSFDYVDGMFESNFFGMKLERWPATKVTRLQLKYPHTQTVSVPPGMAQPPLPSGTPGAYQTYSIPPGWVALRRNRLNVVAAFGTVTVQTDQSAIANAGGIFSYITGFGRGAYQPAMIECWYTAGFTPDQLPASIWDLIVTLASIRFLEQIFPTLVPYQSVNVQIDGVSQSASINLPQLIMKRIEMLNGQYTAKLAAINKNFGKTIKMSFIGA
jgi:hypothetical protein